MTAAQVAAESTATAPAEIASTVNGNGHRNGAVLLPRMSAAGITRYLGREHQACGPGLVAVRVKQLAAAQKQPEMKLLVGALEDTAAACIAWANHIRHVQGIPRKT